MKMSVNSQKTSLKPKDTKRKWWKKPPRSSRICLRCSHKYSSHIDVKCLKIVEREPERKECDCRGFIGNSMELDMVRKREKTKNTS